MSNRFKFRVWDNNENEYLQEGALIDSRTGDIAGYFPVDQFTIEQCTLLKDKNGKLIYENDIVRFHWTEQEPQEFVVKWNNSKKCFDFNEYKNKKRGSRFYYWWECFKTGQCEFAEIVSNVHEMEEK